MCQLLETIIVNKNKLIVKLFRQSKSGRYKHLPTTNNDHLTVNLRARTFLVSLSCIERDTGLCPAGARLVLGEHYRVYLETIRCVFKIKATFTLHIKSSSRSRGLLTSLEKPWKRLGVTISQQHDEEDTFSTGPGSNIGKSIGSERNTL